MFKRGDHSLPRVRKLTNSSTIAAYSQNQGAIWLIFMLAYHCTKFCLKTMSQKLMNDF